MAPRKDGADDGVKIRGQRPTTKWNLLFFGFLALATTACVLSVLTGTILVPETHEAQEMHHSKNHPSFDAPGQLRNHNQDHKAQFEKAYRMAAEAKKQPIQNKEEPKPIPIPIPIPINPIHDNNDNSNNSNNNNEKQSQKYHMVFSTSCSPFQNWQSLAFFYFARKVRQPGTVTRLVAGCTDEQSKALRKVHRERVIPLQIPGLQTFEMHITPGFDDSGGGDQKYFNKPNGLLHWMEESLGFDGTSEHEDDASIIIILDPDMMLLRPITEDFTSKNYVGGWTDSENTRKHSSEGHDLVDYQHDIVSHGRPHAQRYGFGNGWLTAIEGHMEEVVGPDSPALKVSNDDALDYYPAGPPYVATGKDMYQIAVHWVKFLPKYHEFFQGMMCEMHSYSLAAAHLQLPHKLADGFMVSDLDSNENFSFVDDKMTKSSVCQNPPNLVEADPNRAFDPKDTATMTDVAYEKGLGIAIRELPFVLHYCQRYALGRYFFSKYKLREDVFDTCDAPLMIEPPRNVAEIYDWNMFPNGIEHWDFLPDPDSTNLYRESKKKIIQLRNGWLLCAVVYGVNEAIQHYKTASCGTNEEYFQKTWHFHDDKNFTQSLEDPSNPLAKNKQKNQQQQQQNRKLVELGITKDNTETENNPSILTRNVDYMERGGKSEDYGESSKVSINGSIDGNDNDNDNDNENGSNDDDGNGDDDDDGSSAKEQ